MNMNDSLLIQRQICPACKSQDFVNIYSCSYGYEALDEYLKSTYPNKNWISNQLKTHHYSLVQCKECDLIFQKEVPSEHLMYQIYGENSSTYQPYSRDNLSYYTIYSQDITQILLFLNKPPHTIKVLDFGMGWGRWALMAKAFGCEVYGIELSPERLKYAKSNGISCLTLETLREHQFDFINTDQVIEHLAYPLETLAQLKQSLKPDGIIKICVPNSFGIRYRLKYMDWKAPKGSLKSLNPVAPLEHLNCFYRKSMLKLAETVGLKEIKIPVIQQYQCMLHWYNNKKILRNLIMPVYRNILGLQNYYLFQLKDPYSLHNQV